MNELTIKTNNVPRDIVYGFELTEVQRIDFDYMTPEEIDESQFVKYLGYVHALNEFMTTRSLPEFSPLARWDGYKSDSFFSGQVLRYTDESCERVIMGRYLS